MRKVWGWIRVHKLWAIIIAFAFFGMAVSNLNVVPYYLYRDVFVTLIVVKFIHFLLIRGRNKKNKGDDNA